MSGAIFFPLVRLWYCCAASVPLDFISCRDKYGRHTFSCPMGIKKVNSTTMHGRTRGQRMPLSLSTKRICIISVILFFLMWLLLRGESTDTRQPVASGNYFSPTESSSLAEQERTVPDACTYTNFTSDPVAHAAHLRDLLRHILSFGPRVGGSTTKGYFGVMRALSSMMQCRPSLNSTQPVWRLSHHNFTDTTPIGVMQFTNLVSVIDNPYFENGDADKIDRSKRRHFPRSAGRKRLHHLVLAAHWDSKLMKGPKAFLGACDSVVPIIIVLELMKMISHTLQSAASSNYHRSIARNLLPQTVTVVFFDGEEAFVHWQGNDHTYGSRHLAQEWQQTGRMETIDLFALLDLMGPAGLTFHNYLPSESGAFFESLHVAEKRLRSRGRLLTAHTAFPFEPVRRAPPIDDDHIHWTPHVPVLHMIAYPFPKVWHTPADDESAIDLPTTIDLLHVVAHGLIGFPMK